MLPVIIAQCIFKGTVVGPQLVDDNNCNDDERGVLSKHRTSEIRKPMHDMCS